MINPTKIKKSKSLIIDHVSFCSKKNLLLSLFHQIAKMGKSNMQRQIIPYKYQFLLL